MIFLYKTGKKFYPAMLANHLMKSCTPFQTHLIRDCRGHEESKKSIAPKHHQKPRVSAWWNVHNEKNHSSLNDFCLLITVYDSFFQLFGEKFTHPNGGNSPPGKTQLPYKTKKCQKSLELIRNLNTNWCHWFKEVLWYRLNPPDWRKNTEKKNVRPEKWTLSAVPMQNCKATALVAPQIITFVF